MLKTSRIIIVFFTLTYLTACSIDGTTNSLYNYGSYNYGNAPMIYPDSYNSYQYPEGYSPNNSQTPMATEKVEVPDSYHMGYGHPTSAKDMDKNWVKGQNPNSYTIELANDSKPSKVAGILYKAPKNERSAEIRTNKGSYTGVYGTYPSYEAAKAKLESLPEDVKQNANIKTWGNIQSETNE